jgi:hypothetical protein
MRRANLDVAIGSSALSSGNQFESSCSPGVQIVILPSGGGKRKGNTVIRISVAQLQLCAIHLILCNPIIWRFCCGESLWYGFLGYDAM